MAERSATGSAILASALAGSVLGAAGLAWWLLRAADQRRLTLGRITARLPLSLSALQSGGRDGELEQKVNDLNRAIEDVRRQLESLAPEG